MDEEFFREMFRKPVGMEYSYHPPERVLWAYLSGALGDEWHFDREFLPRLRRADLDGDWGLSEVSLHLLTCNHCTKRVAQLRKEEVAALEESRAEKSLTWLRALVRLRGRLASWLSSGQGMERRYESLTRPWPAGQPLGIGLISLSLGFLPLVFGRVSALPPVSPNLFHQYLRSGL